jgi:hypothetical protein
VLVFLASPLVFLIRPVRKRKGLRNAAQVIVGAFYLITFLLLWELLWALNGMRG